MDAPTKLTALSEAFNPLKPLAAAETDLYVDWQNQLDGADDVKRRLVNSLARSSDPTTRLFTGHRGNGKTTELNRVRQRLEAGVDGQKVFVSLLPLAERVGLDDLQAEALIVQIVLQLVTDLEARGYRFARAKLTHAFGDLWKRVRVVKAQVGPDLLKLDLKVDTSPAVRTEFRKLLSGQLDSILDLVNKDILRTACDWLAKPEHGGYARIAIIVDELDRMRRRTFDGHSNQEELFLGGAGTLRALACDVLYTMPIELAFSRAHGRLEDEYGSTIFNLPAVPITTRTGAEFGPGMEVLRKMVGQRLHKAVPAWSLNEWLAEPAQLDVILRSSGGHVRGLFVILATILNNTDELPVSRRTVERGLKRAAADLAVPLWPDDWTLLAEVHSTRQPVGTDPDAWNELLRDRFVLAYEDDDGHWYDRHPLLERLQPQASP